MSTKSKNALYKIKWKSTPQGFLSNLYSKMIQRVKGNPNHTRQPAIYKDKPICSREEFLTWGLEDPQFKKLFKSYLENGRELSMAPSIDRVDSAKGYTLDNVQFLTQGQNSSKARTIVTPPKAKTA